MRKPSAPLFVLLLVGSVLAATVGCGGGSSRQLQSITANSSGMIQIELTATGTFSASPISEAPLPVAWFVVGGTVNPPSDYTLTSQPLDVSCQSFAVVVALAPANPKAPTTGTIPNQVYQDLIVNRTSTSEDGFVASSPQTIACP